MGRSLVVSLFDTVQPQPKGDIEFEIAQLEEQMECAESEGEREELNYQISELYDKLEEE